MKLINDYLLHEGSLIKFPNVQITNKIKSWLSKVSRDNKNVQTDINNKINDIRRLTKQTKIFPIKSEITEVKQLSDLLKRSEKIEVRLDKLKKVDLNKISKPEAEIRLSSVEYAERLIDKIKKDYQKIKTKAESSIEDLLKDFNI